MQTVFDPIRRLRWGRCRNHPDYDQPWSRCTQLPPTEAASALLEEAGWVMGGWPAPAGWAGAAAAGLSDDLGLVRRWRSLQAVAGR